MKHLKKLIIALAALGALALGGTQIAAATGGAAEKDDGADEELTGPKADQASAAAVKAVGGSAESVEASDEPGGTYEVEVTRGGESIEVTVDSSFSVTKQVADDNETGSDDDDGEADDDDGETDD